LWNDAGAIPAADRLLVSGRGMSMALRHAHERSGYTLSDEATFRQMQRQIDLVVLFEGDRRLLNTYAVIHVPESAGAAAFAEWLTRGEGRRHIASYRVEGQAAFVVWPPRCPDGRADAEPCA
jgi:ABC-type tungstate transport system permease subunit